MAKRVGSCPASSRDILHTSACRSNCDQEIGEYQDYEEHLQLPSGAADEYVKSMTQSHRAYQKGEMVQVLSRTTKSWAAGQVVDPVIDGCHTVEFEIPGQGTAYYPGARIVNESDAFCALHDFVISFESSDIPVENMVSLDEELQLKFKRNNAFKASRWGSALHGPFSIAYKPRRDVGNDIVDVVLKVHALPAEEPDKDERYKPVGHQNFVHTLLHQQGEKVHFNPDIPGHYFLGLTVHKDLSIDLREKMVADKNGDKAYYEMLLKRFKESWEEKGDAEGDTIAKNAHYIISYTGHNKVANDKLLMEITTNPITGPHCKRTPTPVRFCTDRSLGFGQHFHQREGGFTENTPALFLGKHGFAQPPASDGWWGEYTRAAHQTMHGILVLNPSQEYFESKACVKEWHMSGITQEKKKARMCKLWVYNPYKGGKKTKCPDDIITAKEYVRIMDYSISQSLSSPRSLCWHAHEHGVAAIDPRLLRDAASQVHPKYKRLERLEWFAEVAMSAFDFHDKVDTERANACLEAVKIVNRNLQASKGNKTAETSSWVSSWLSAHLSDKRDKPGEKVRALG